MLKTNKNTSGSKVPSWMVTFADLMTLLLTFFVLLLSYSSLDVKKYKEASNSLFKAFNEGSFIEDKPGEHSMVEFPLSHKGDIQIENKLDNWLDKTKTTLHKEIDNNTLLIKQVGDGIMISIKEQAAFASGSDNLQASFIPYLRKIASIIPAGKATIVVSGHTDSLPIVSNHKIFRSNWDLSTLRATSVVHKLIEISDIPEDKIIAQGHADTKPIASNKTKKGRSMNRRVEITLFPEKEPLAQPLNGGNTHGIH